MRSKTLKICGYLIFQFNLPSLNWKIEVDPILVRQATTIIGLIAKKFKRSIGKALYVLPLSEKEKLDIFLKEEIESFLQKIKEFLGEGSFSDEIKEHYLTLIKKEVITFYELSKNDEQKILEVYAEI